MTALTFDDRVKAGASPEVVATRHPRWPLAVIALGLSASAVWSASLGYSVYWAVARLVG